MADVTVVSAGVYGNGLSKIYRQHAPLPRNEEPGAVLRDVGLRSTHFADDVAIRELLVIRDAGGDRGSIAVPMYDVVAGIDPVVVRGRQFHEVLHETGLGLKDSIIVTE
jgi:hypothetical protein